jgi:hypothetical protein
MFDITIIICMHACMGGILIRREHITTVTEQNLTVPVHVSRVRMRR